MYVYMYVRAYIQACMNIYMHAHIHTYVHTYTHTDSLHTGGSYNENCYRQSAFIAFAVQFTPALKIESHTKLWLINHVSIQSNLLRKKVTLVHM